VKLCLNFLFGVIYEYEAFRSEIYLHMSYRYLDLESPKRAFFKILSHWICAGANLRLVSEGSFFKLTTAQVGAYTRACTYPTLAPGSAELHRHQLFCRGKNLFKKLASGMKQNAKMPHLSVQFTLIGWLVGLERDGSKNHILTNRGDQVSL
jgi:hypothetical protein